MSMQGNPYIQNLENVGMNDSEAQVQATLALAFEQRTANLLAFEQTQWAAFENGNLTEDGKRLWQSAAEQIIQRLGLK